MTRRRNNLAVAAIFLTARSCSSFTTSRFLARQTVNLHQYGGDNGGQQYYDQNQQQNYGQDQQQFYDADGNPIQAQQPQFYDAEGNPIYTYDPTQQQQQQQQPPQQQQSEPSLLITDNMQEEMVRATSNVEPGGIDYLANARLRAAERTPSKNSQSTEEDWVRIAEEKRRLMSDEQWQNSDISEEDADWEKSLSEAGDEDAAAMGMGVELTEDEDGFMTTNSGLVVDNEGSDGGLLL